MCSVCPAPLTDNIATAAGFDVEVAANEAVANPVKVANLAGLAKTRWAGTGDGGVACEMEPAAINAKAPRHKVAKGSRQEK